LEKTRLHEKQGTTDPIFTKGGCFANYFEKTSRTWENKKIVEVRIARLK
jgi:hypothetical protein